MRRVLRATRYESLNRGFSPQAPFGSIEWLFRTYKASNDWEAKVSALLIRSCGKVLAKASAQHASNRSRVPNQIIWNMRNETSASF
jgi:hypothetical protein